MELDPKVYSSKKVSRKEREEQALKIQDDESSEDLDSLENAMQTRDVDDSDDEE